MIILLLLPLFACGQIVPDTFAVYRSPVVNIVADQSGNISGGVVYASSSVRFNWQNIEDGDYGYLYVNHRTAGNAFSYAAGVVAQGSPSQMADTWDEVRWNYTGGVIRVYVRPYDYFDISQVPDVVLRLDANAGTYSDAGAIAAANGGTIQQWNDQSVNANHASQDTAARKPILRANSLNGYSGIEWDGIDDRMAVADSDDFDVEDGLSFFYVGNPTTDARIFQKGYGSFPGDIIFGHTQTGMGVYTVYDFDHPPQMQMLSTVYTGNYERQWLWGAQQGYLELSTLNLTYTDTVGSDYFASHAAYRNFLNTADPLVIGGRYGTTGLHYDGVMYYVLLIQRAVTEAERSQIEGFLCWRFGLQDSLAAAHPYRYHPPKAGYYSSQWDSYILSDNPHDSYRGSPSVVRLPNDSLLFVCDYYPDDDAGVFSDTTYVYLSADDGMTWNPKAKLNNIYWASPFVDGSDVYLIGNGGNWGSVTIVKSDDYAQTWGAVSTLKAGSDGPANLPSYGNAPFPVLTWNGYHYIGMGKLFTSSPASNRPFVMRAPVGGVLTDSASWEISNYLQWDAQWLDTIGITTNTEEYFFENGVIENTVGSLVSYARLRTYPVVNKAVLMNLDTSSMTLSFSKIIDLPGGNVKYCIIDDRDSTGYYLSITNPNRVGTLQNDQRNILAMYKSENLEDWEWIGDIMADDYNNDVAQSLFRIGFQYPYARIDGDDLLLAVRVAYYGSPILDSADPYHNAERNVFKRIRNFRNLLR